MNDTRMVWVDIETTGLDPKVDVPIELGLAITDSDGNMEASDSWFIHDRSMEFAMALGRGAAHEVVGPMHEKSGLWDALANKKMTNKLVDVDDMASAFLDSHDIVVREQAICGSSVGSLDRPFLAEHFPFLYKCFSHRNIDISTIKEICMRKNPNVYEGLQKYVPKRELHRVMPDIEDSVAEYQYYLNEFLIW